MQKKTTFRRRWSANGCISLLDLIAILLECDCLDDLRHITKAQKEKLVRELHRLEGEDTYLHDWNEALCYITNSSPAPSAEMARKRLIDYLSNETKLVQHQCF